MSLDDSLIMEINFRPIDANVTIAMNQKPQLDLKVSRVVTFE